MPRSSSVVRLNGIVARAMGAPSTFRCAIVTSGHSTQPRWVANAVRGYSPAAPVVINTSYLLPEGSRSCPASQTRPTGIPSSATTWKMWSGKTMS
ncbi:hypothetical protein [Candidatus Nitrosocosmicus arcticus]|uniref:hypothetical protein n=1 Tax=Candidatus Nitrosocosmicus arcticus TaxID=2035267 RepID=UPI0021BDDBE7|nr:hypothetical protein [Candidatus Nitrosocosmicus arcticus]